MDNLSEDTRQLEVAGDKIIVRKAVKEKMRSDSSRESSTSRKKPRHNSKSESDKSDKKLSKPQKKPIELETETLILQRRQKQIDYGKNTVGYHNYLQQVPLDQRTKDHPKTPEKYAKYSRRSWDTLIKIWRKKLHEYDTNASTDVESDEKSDDST